MDKVTVTQADRDKAADAHEDQFALWGGDLARQVSDLTRSGGRDDTLLVQAFAHHRIEATRQAEEQIKLLREALAFVVSEARLDDSETTAGRAAAQEHALHVIAASARAALEATNG